MSREHKRSAALKEMLAGAIEQTADSVVITDSRGNIEYVNPAFEKNSGYRRDEVLGRTPRIVKSGVHDESFYKMLWGTILGGRIYRAVITNRRKDGSLYYEEKTITPLRDAEDRITHFVSTGKDVTERVKAEEKLNYLAHHDTLTGLPNRNLLRDRLDQAIRRTARHDGRFAVLILDLDNFKTVNDSLGHEMGDLLLKAVGERLQALVRDGDTVARLGGDEFVVVLEDTGRTEDAADIARKLIENLSTVSFEVDGHKIFLTVSIGVAAAPTDGTEVDTLLKHADTALYRAKERGRNAYQMYTAEMTAQVRERLRLRTQTQLALERGEYLLYYQPIVDLKTGEVAAVEALIRWRHPEQGIVTPDVFIPVLEESGLIARVGEWVLRTVCEHIREFQKLREKPVRVAVNVSGKQLNDPDFAKAVGCMRCLSAGNGRCAGIAEFEVTENVLVRNDAVTAEILGALRANGVRLAIDDFGTGYSTLAYLARFAPDTTKIDRSFIRDIETDPRAAALVGAIVAMSHALGAIVVAEGVETPGQLAMLRASGCDMFQGYLFSPPLPVDEVRRLLGSGAGLAR